MRGGAGASVTVAGCWESFLIFTVSGFRRAVAGLVVFVFTTHFIGFFAVGTVVIIRISGTLDVCIRDSRWEVPAEWVLCAHKCI